MIVYQSSKKGFTEDVISNQIDAKIYDMVLQRLGRKTGQSEIDSWKNSLLFMNNILIGEDIPGDAQVSVEFQIPLTSKRIDFIISGNDEEGNDNVVIVELKQWQKAELSNRDGIVKTHMQGRLVETTHPSYQAWSYAALLKGFNQTVYDEGIMLKRCAYLHNYERDDVIVNEAYKDYIKKAPVFLREDALKLKDFIRKYIKFGDRTNIMYRIDHGKIKPSKHLADSLASMLKGNKEFVMIDDQKVVFERAMALAQRTSEEEKYVLIVEGGPGTGKSVVAINLLVEMTKKGLVAQYVTKNAAPREVYASKLTGTLKKTEYNNLFKGSGAFVDTKENTFDALIVDEAHRLNLKSGLYGNLGKNQILEIMHAAKFTVFFVDDLQKIHIKDVGDKRRIQIHAEEEGAHVETLSLKSQFRCNGSDGYLAWLNNTLQIRETANVYHNPEDFDFQIFDSPTELRTAIEEKNKGYNKARMVAGYCWDWISKNDPGAYDIEFPEEDFQMQWNLTKDGPAWLVAEGSIEQIGCIHTCQGLELDYVGVIVGDDIRYEGGKVVTDVYNRSRNDNSIRGIKKMLKENPEEAKELADRIIKNTYRTLMTRGMKGCYVYLVDGKLSQLFQSRIMKL